MMINCPKHGNTRAIYIADKTSDEAVITKCYMCNCEELYKKEIDDNKPKD